MSSSAASRASSTGGASCRADEGVQGSAHDANPSQTPSVVSAAGRQYKATHMEEPLSVMTPPSRASPGSSAIGALSTATSQPQPQLPHSNAFASIPRVALDSDASPQPPANRSQPFAGTLFPSFDHEANYLAKQAELRSLGGFYATLDDEEGDAIGRRSTSSSQPQGFRGREEASREAAEDLKVLERQIKRRDELYVAAQRRADEAKEYSSMIAHLRAEAKRSEQMHSDVHNSLVAQVESLQYVVQRRNDADNQTAKVRFVDVEDEVQMVSKELGDDITERQRLVDRLGEQSIEYVEQLAKQATGVVYELEHQEVLEKEARETEELLLQQVTIKVSMVSDRIRSELCKALSNEMRAAYLIAPGGGTSTAIRRVLSAFAARDVERMAASIHDELQGVLQTRAASAYTESYDDLPHLIEHTFQTVESQAARVLENALSQKAVALDAEARQLNEHLEGTRRASDHRRRHEEAALRDVILDMGKLLESQRLAMNDLRTQLLLQARAQSIATSPRSGKVRGSGSTSASAQRTKSRSPAAGSSAAVAHRHRPSSPSTSKRLLFEPLSEHQIKSLYGSLPTQATVVEEVSVERLSRITAKATHAKKASQHEQDQLILVSRAPASLLGRGSNSKVPTKLTSVGLQNKQGGATPSAADGGNASAQHHGASGGGKGGKPGYSNGELATLQELRRLRVKIGSTPS